MMDLRQTVTRLLLVATIGLMVAGCGSDTAAPPTALPGAPTVAGSSNQGANPTASGAPDKIRLQLKWLNQAQFAGYYVAADKGYYKDRNLDVEIIPGGPDVVPSQKVLTGAADVGIDWVGSLLANRDKGQSLLDVAQIFQSSGLLLISKKSANINGPADLKGKKVGVWTGGNEFEFRALMDKYKLDDSIDNNKDMTVIKQGFEMDTFLNGQLDAASATTYNEYPVVLEAGVKPEDLNIINYNGEGVGMLEDHLFVNQDWIKSHKDALVRFLAASQKGWVDAVQSQAAAVDSVMSRVDKAGTTRAHQETMMKEVSKLVMPDGATPRQVGLIDTAKFQTTADIALKFGVIKNPAKDAYINDYINIASQMNGYGTK